MRELRYHEGVTRRPPDNIDLIRRILGNDYLELRINKLILEDDFKTEKTSVQVYTQDTHGNEQIVRGSGNGLVGALWSGFLERYAVEYESLRSVELASFSVSAVMDTKKGTDGSDAIGEVKLEVKNSDGRRFSFGDASRSMASSTARAVTAVIEYFVNAERAFITLYKSRQDAKERARDDLVNRYTRELAEVVKSTSYAQVIENIKKELD